MAKTSKTALVIIGIASAILAVPINAFIHGQLFKPNTAEIVLENKTTTPVSSIEVSLCGDTKRSPQVGPGEKSSIQFEIAGDCHFSVEVSFEGGREIKADIGYVTGGMNSKFPVIITEDKLVEEKSVIESDPNALPKTIALFGGYLLVAFILFLIGKSIAAKLRKQDVSSA